MAPKKRVKKSGRYPKGARAGKPDERLTAAQAKVVMEALSRATRDLAKARAEVAAAKAAAEQQIEELRKRLRQASARIQDLEERLETNARLADEAAMDQRPHIRRAFAQLR